LTGFVSSPTLDTTVEERLAQEAEEKACQAEKDAEEQECVRKERLEAKKALKESSNPATTAHNWFRHAGLDCSSQNYTWS
jgi:hypothetical protein